MGGVPGQVLSDQGKEFLANDVTRFAMAVGFVAHPVVRYSPTDKGKIERFFGTLERQALAGLPGYTGGPKLRDRTEPFKGDPKDCLDAERLTAHLASSFDLYNHRVHSSLGRSPLEAWVADPTAVSRADEALLRPHYHRVGERKVSKSGVELQNRHFLGATDAFLESVGERVTLRARHLSAEELEVFKGKEWLGTVVPQERLSTEDKRRITRWRVRRSDQLEERTRRAQEIRVADAPKPVTYGLFVVEATEPLVSTRRRRRARHQTPSGQTLLFEDVA